LYTILRKADIASTGIILLVSVLIAGPGPAGAKLTDDQYKAFKAGNLYVNVHSDANKSGEIRGQLKP